MPKIGVMLPVEENISLPGLVGLAESAESLGYEAVICGEVSGPEVMVTLGMVAARTEKILIGSGIIPTYTRSPVLSAMGFASLSSMAPGRVAAGFGASSPIVVENWHGIGFSKPLTTTREFLIAFREVIGGEKVQHSSGCFPINGFRLGIDPAGRIKIWLAAINDQMLRLAGELADGVFLAWCPPDEVPAKLEQVQEGAKLVGRSLDDLEVVVTYWGFAGEPSEAEKIREKARRAVLAYAMVPTHKRAFVESFSNLEEATLAWEAGDRRRALELTDDDAVDAMCAIGDEKAVAKRALEYIDAGVDLPAFLTVTERGDTSLALETLRHTSAELRL